MLELNAPQHILNGSLHLPKSKSLFNRALILDFLRKKNISPVSTHEPDDVQLLITALLQINSRQNKININHAGTAMRFLTALLSITPGEWMLDGSERMRQRPIAGLVDALIRLGADIKYLNNDGFPPLVINGKKLNGGICEIDAGISSQFISALMLIAPFLKNGLQINLQGKMVSKPYLEMTLKMLDQLQTKTFVQENQIHIQPGIGEMNVEIEADWTSASYIFSCCALQPGSSFTISGLWQNSLQGDKVVMEIFKELGVHSHFEADLLKLHHVPVNIKKFNYDFDNCPDLAQTLAVTCFGLGIDTNLTGLSTLEIKESNRIEALHQELSKLGAEIQSGSDFIQFKSRKSPIPPGATINTYNDHRMALSFAPLCLVAGRILIENESVVNKSWPLFWQDLLSLGFSVNLQPS